MCASVFKKSPSDDLDTFAWNLFFAIKKLDYKEIEKLVKDGRDKGLLNVKDEKGNTFIHLIVLLIGQSRNTDIPDIDDSAPLIHNVINV